MPGIGVRTRRAVVCAVAIVGWSVAASAQPNPDLLWTNSAFTNWITAVNKNTGQLVREIDRSGLGNGLGIAVVGNVIYYTVKDQNVYMLDKTTGAELGIAFSVPQSIVLSTIAFDGRNLWVGDYETSHKVFYYTPKGVLLKTITIANCTFQCDGLEYFDGKLIANRSFEANPATYDIYDTNGNLLQSAFITTLTHAGRSIAYDGSFFYITDPDEIFVYSATTGLLVRSMKPGGTYVNYRDLSIEYAQPQPIAFDTDGDNKSEIAVYRPSIGGWFLRDSTRAYSAANFSYFQWGMTGDLPQSADFDGDGKADLGIYRPSDGSWLLRYSTRDYSIADSGSYQWGIPGDLPVAGDFDGDNKTDLAVWRPSIGGWFIRYSTKNYAASEFAYYQWGLPGDVPLRADFDGDGRADLAVYRPSNGTWYIRNSSQNYNASTFTQYQWGLSGDVPVPGDFDGDGKNDLAVYRPSTGEWFIRYSMKHFETAGFGYYQWGLTGDQPVAGDFDGDGKTELAVYRPSDGVWYMRLSTLNYSFADSRQYQWGLSGDVPVAH